MFVPLISEAAMAVVVKEAEGSKVDDVLLEYQHAIVLNKNKAKRLAVLPVFIGERSEVSLISFSDFKSLTLTILQDVYEIRPI